VRIEGWKPELADNMVDDYAEKRLVEAANLVAEKAKANCHIGTVARMPYKTGKYAGKYWTGRIPGRLQASIRVDRKLTKSFNISRSKSAKKKIRVAMGNETAYYAAAFEYGQDGKPVLRPAFWNSIPQIKSILGVK